MKLIVKLNIFLLLGLEITACTNRNLEEVVPSCNPDNVVSFGNVVSPIINAKCAISGCHTSSNSYIPYLETFSQVKSNSNDILTQIYNGAMPPSDLPQLTKYEKTMIACWINQGAKTP